MAQPSLQYERIKSFILAGIDDGKWEFGARIPSENQLAERFSLSRMTVNRAIKELEADGVVDRVQGKGTFVSAPRPLKSVLQIRGIKQEIESRGNEYSCKVLKLRSANITEELSQPLKMQIGSNVWTSSIVHCENKIPVQFEQRWVRPSIWKRYLQQDFTQQTPHDYLMSQTPFTQGEHTIEACIANTKIQRILEMATNEPCLLIHRRTWVRKMVASYVRLYHPGKRYQLTTQLTRK